MTFKHYYYIILPGCLLPSLGRAQNSSGQFQPMEATLVLLNSSEGKRLLQDSRCQEPFWALSQFYSPQPNLASCSVASCTMVLNALPVERPVSRPHGSFKLFTSDNFFTPQVESIVTRSAVFRSGMTLDQLARSLGTYPVKARCVFAADSNIGDFRKTLADILSGSDAHVLVNFDRKTIGQAGGGHISPLGAYNQEKDMVLILDTANYKFPWAWVNTERLWNAMAGTTDPSSNRSRGYVVVSAPAPKS